jgi:hypothetical protein
MDGGQPTEGQTVSAKPARTGPPTGEQEQKDEKKVTRNDIEAKLRELRGGVETRVADAKDKAVVVAVAVAVAAVVTAYWLGRRRGKRRQTVLEIRRLS